MSGNFPDGRHLRQIVIDSPSGIKGKQFPEGLPCPV